MIYNNQAGIHLKPRNLFFDLLRIACVGLIVYAHDRYLPWTGLNDLLFPNGWFSIPYPKSLGMLAVYGLIFVSGAVLELNYSSVDSLSGYARFIGRRCLRLYPAYWLSLVLGLLIVPSLLHTGAGNILLEFSGFYIWAGSGNQKINAMGWFIGMILVLYLLFPLLSRCMRAYPVGTMTVFTAVTFLSRYILLNLPGDPYTFAWRFLPICNLFEFGLGIFIVQKGFYPKNTHDHPVIAAISEFSFYVFLFHFIVVQNLGPIVGLPFGLFNNYEAFYVLIAAEFLFISALVMVFDERLQRYLAEKVAGSIHSGEAREAPWQPQGSR